jgi:hypothetical protein
MRLLQENAENRCPVVANMAGNLGKFFSEIKNFGIFEPVPKPHGFSTGSWKKRSKARFFPLNLRWLFQN